MGDLGQFKMTASDAMKFVKVTVIAESGRVPGYLTDLSCELLAIELERHGYCIVEKSTADQ